MLIEEKNAMNPTNHVVHFLVLNLYYFQNVIFILYINLRDFSGLLIPIFNYPNMFQFKYFIAQINFVL